LSCMYRADLDYGGSADPSWPKTLVFKFTPPNMKTRIIGALLNMYESEVNWYENDMPTKSKLPAPKTFYQAYGGYGRYVLVMEDLAPAKPLDQMVGTSFEDAALAVTSMASLHARYRNRVYQAEETGDWLKAKDDADWMPLATQSFKDAYKAFTPERYKQLGLSKDEVPEFVAIADFLMATWDKFSMEYMNNFKRKNPHAHLSTTLIHGDLRGENVYPSAGKDGGLKIIDYQIVQENFGEQDISYFLGTSVTEDKRKEFEIKILPMYVEAMHKAGARDLTWDEVLLNYQKGLATIVLYYVVSQNDCDITIPRARDLVAATIRRANVAMKEWQIHKGLSILFDKLGPDGVASKFSPAELREALPPFTHQFLK